MTTINNDEYRYTSEETLLKVEGVGLTLTRDGVESVILRDVNCSIENIRRPGHANWGQVVGLLAPSGMGKTKLFEVISGIRKPTVGKVLVNKEQHPVEQGMVGVLQQNYPLFRHRTVKGNLYIAAKKGFPHLSSKEQKDKVDFYLEKFGLKERMDFYPSQLSGGQRQRIAIVQQLLCSENLLLFDEPFSGLDVLMVDECLSLIRDVSNITDENTLVLVSHDIPSIVNICDHVWVMGRDRDEQGAVIPGAKIKYEFNLIDEGLAWRPDIESLPKFGEVVSYFKSLFPTL
jgi:polar amino acid transport system ATP-binding protein/sulfate transport system ATP-binding protein